VLAYEPVWAIGTGRSASAKQAQEAHAFLRLQVAAHHGVELSREVRIIHGGSVTTQNFSELLSQPDIDGGLLGGASLNPQTFLDLVAQAKRAR